MMRSGQQIRDYVLDSKIGEGGMGEVWRAHHLVLDRKVAIKVMSTHIAADPEFEQRFVQEARAQATLNHPRILGVNDFFIQDQVYYLVMPLVEGESLELRIDAHGGPLPHDHVVQIADDLLDALDYAHQRGIIHRDVKPSNILLDAHGRAYLMDFGIALLVGQDRRTRTGTSLGTPHYMSPEQIRHPRSIDHRTDVYSVGCVLFEALTGRPPFLPSEQGDTDFQVKEAHLYQPPPPIRSLNPAVPEGLANLLMRALAKDPEARFAGCGEFLRALREYRYRGHVAPPPPQGPPRPLPPVHPPVKPPDPPKSKGLGVALAAGGGGCLLLVIVLLVIGYLISLDDSTPMPSYEPAPTPAEVEEAATPEVMEEGMEEMGAEFGEPPAPGGSYQEQIQRFLASTGETFTERGFVATHNPHIDRISADGDDSVTFELDADTHYFIVGVCDTDCGDLDMQLFDDHGNSIDEDYGLDDFPVVEVTPAWTGEFSLSVDMAACSEDYCYYGIGIYGQR